jgi:Ca-activated chloride channel homolog
MDWAYPHFAEPRWLWLALLAPGLLTLMQRYAARARHSDLSRFLADPLMADLLRSHSPVRRMLKNILLILACMTIGIAMARPQWGRQARTERILGEDILFLIDCSRSMLTTDVRPNRLARAKLAVLDYVQRYGRGRVGLVAFAGQAFLQCPLTDDYEAFHDALMAIDERTIPVPGTDLGRALDEARLAMESNQRRKLMVLVSDGEDLENRGIESAKTLSREGAVIFTIGVGTARGAPVPLDNDQTIGQFVRDKKGQVVESHLDEPTLKSIARLAGGTYQPLGSLGEGMSQLHQLVDAHWRRPGLSPAPQDSIDRYYFPVAAVILLLVGESLIGTRRKQRDDYAQ